MTPATLVSRVLVQLWYQLQSLYLGPTEMERHRSQSAQARRHAGAATSMETLCASVSRKDPASPWKQSPSTKSKVTPQEPGRASRSQVAVELGSIGLTREGDGEDSKTPHSQTRPFQL
jgi:hypothetical protein